MPTYKVKPDKNYSMESRMTDDPGYPQVHIPVSTKIMDSLEMGMKAKVMLIGEIKSMRSDEKGNEICMEVMEVSAYPAGKSKTMKEEIDEGLGYKDSDEKMKDK